MISRGLAAAHIPVAVATLSFFTGAAWADRVVLSGTYSQSDILKSCVVAGGSFSSGPGAYGCSTDKGSVTCNTSGKCYGSCDSCGKPAVVHKGRTIFGILQGTTVKAGPNTPTKTEAPKHFSHPVAYGYQGGMNNAETHQGRRK
jgi:hypothetical protein